MRERERERGERETERDRDRERQTDRQTSDRQTDRVNHILIFKKAMFWAFCWPTSVAGTGGGKSSPTLCASAVPLSIALRFLPSFLPKAASSARTGRVDTPSG